MKKTKIIFWVTTGFIFLFEGVLVALTSQTEMAQEGIRHLGYPEYFGTTLAIFKVFGAVTMILPRMPAQFKNIAYLGFTFNFFFAFVSHWVVDGFGGQAVFPLAMLGILAVSYVQWQKLQGPVAADDQPQFA